MASPETYLAHSVSLVKKIKSGELKADKDFLVSHLGNSYTEELKGRIVDCALKLAQCEDINKAAWPAKDKKK